MFEGRALRSEKLRPAFGDVHVVLEADPKFAAQIDTGLVAEGHVWLQWESVAANQIRPFVAIHTDSMTDAMGEVRVIRAVAGSSDNFARSGVHGLAFDSRFGGFQSSLLVR